jgi:ribosomal protein S18 acetylase RimI-like enzyme
LILLPKEEETQMPTPAIQIARIREDQIDLAAGILARAFHTDPPFVYMLPDPTERARVLPPFMRMFVKYAFMFGDPLTTAEKAEAVALWLPLDDLSDTSERDRQAGIDQIPAIFGADAFKRLMHIATISERFHQQSVPGKHLYLQFLSVEPSRQGQGLGSALIRAMTERADAEGLQCYLDTFQPRNVPLYQKHGFKITVEEVEPNSGVRGWAFLRESRS